MQKPVVGANLQKLSPGSELHASETVRTGNLGQADLVFIDNTNLTVGPASEVLLDKFVYDPIGFFGPGCYASDPRRIPICYGQTRPQRLPAQNSVWDARHVRGRRS